MSFMLLPKLKSLVLCAYKPCQFQTIVKHQLQIYCSKSGFNCSHLLPGKDPFAIVTALSFSENTKSYFLGTQLHAHVIKLGLTKDVFSQNNLIKMYTKCGVFSHAFKLFDDMVERNLVSWTLMISGAVQNGEFQVGLEVYLDLIRSGLQPNEFTLGSVLKICASVGSYEFGSSIHCFALKIGIEHNIFVGGSILNMYAKLEDIQSAKAVFRSMTNVDVGCWNAIIGGYVLCGDGIDAFKTVSLMLSRGVNMDQFTFINTLKGCSIMENLDFGKQLHGLIIQRDMEYSTSLMNCLMDMYFRTGREDSALKVFMRIQNKDVISWNTAFASSQHENARTLVSLFHEFRLDALKPNHITFSILFRLCAELVDLDLGFQFFCLALQFGFLDEANITCSLINMFSRCKAMKLARLIFDNDKVHLRNITAWNELISGYKLNYCYMEALKVFVNLWGLGVELNEYTFSSVLEACSKYENQQMVRQIHGAVVKSGFFSNGYVGSLLLNGYVKFGLLDDCFEFFNDLERLDDLACWGTVISALTRGGHTYEAIRFFRSLKEANGKPDEFIFGSILNCCASIACYRLTKSVHSLVTKMGFDTQIFVASGVMDAYAKCGDINSARMAYRQSYRLNDVIIHNTMIMAFAHHGLVMEAMEVFETMKKSNLQPSQATFVSTISACSHMGLIDRGFLLFQSMITDYKMEPSPDIYGCLVDMLSRNGYLDTARQVIEVMPYTPWPAILRSLLSGCRIHGNRELGEWTANKLLQLVPEHDAPYVLLSKVYSEHRGWEDAGKVWRSMIERGVPKTTGYSRIEI